MRPITREQYEALHAGASGRYRALFDLLWWTGARISEALGDAVTGIPALIGADVLALVERGYVQTSGKGGKRRTLVLPPGGRDALRDFAAGLDGDGPAFPISPQAVNAALHRLGFGGGAHSFRHAYRTRLRQAGVGEEMQRALMGHSVKDVTAGYGVVTVEEMQATAETLA